MALLKMLKNNNKSVANGVKNFFVKKKDMLRHSTTIHNNGNYGSMDTSISHNYCFNNYYQF